jgi:hypothetical protein
MNEVITILTSRSGNQIAKAFVEPEYVQQRFSIGRSFTAHEEPERLVDATGVVIGS